MTVAELIELLSRAPKDNVILADTGREESGEITDVMVGNGTVKGFTYLQIKTEEE